MPRFVECAMVMRRSFEEIRLPVFPHGNGGTCAAGFSSLATRLRTFSFDALRLADRKAFTQLRSVVKPCRAKSTTFRTNCLNVIQRVPGAVCVVSYSFPSRIGHRRLLAAVRNYLTAFGEAVVPQPMGDASDRARL